ncbi:NAD(P)-dependent oxidoreductase [Streptomyces sp. NPDC088194]|uniref:NAD(P)-dependent oxidoreductase n=1 Tax=Streptomyces sp. NPDC088194 TaxID=3154931 RepID=UPI00344E3CEF
MGASEGNPRSVEDIDAEALSHALSSARVIADEALSAELVRALERVVGRAVQRRADTAAGSARPDGRPLVYVGPNLPPGLRDERLLWFHSTNAGVDTVLRGGRWPHGALLTRTVGGMGERIGQYVLAWVLADCQDVPGYLDQHRKRVWQRRPTQLAGGQTAVVFGVGAIGTAVSGALRNCGVRTVGVATRHRAEAGFDRVVTGSQVREVLPTARWVISTLPLTSATEDFFDAGMFASMAGATFMNVGRGGTVDMTALAAALEDGAVGRAVLDVLAEEPAGPDAACWSLPRTVITSHSAGITAESDVVTDFAACWEALQQGRLPRLAVRTAREY